MPDRDKVISVLLIEDDRRDALLLQKMLESEDGDTFSLDVARCLAAGIARLHEKPVDAVLLDLHLPDATGMEGIQPIRKAQEGVPIVIMTGLDDEDVALEAVQAGAQDYLVKGKTDATRLRHSIRYAIERQRLQRELLESQKREQELRMDRLEALGRLAGGIAHDFNNLLMGIMGNISLAKSAQGQELVELLHEAEKASERAALLTRQLLVFSKGGQPVTEVVEIPHLVRDAVSFALRGSNVRAECDFAEDLQCVEVDAGQITQVFQNIAINASQAMPHGGRLWVRAENSHVAIDDQPELAPGDYVRIMLEDEGPGIPEKFLPHIFDPYFTTKQKGSGLGLATAFSVIQKHNGTITVASVLGHGTRFDVHLPASDRQPASVGVMPDISVFRGGRILVMDDEVHVRQVAARYLEQLGFEVTLAADGSEALDWYRAALNADKPFCAVIADLTVPGGMGGRELVKRLRAIDPLVKAVVSSGYSDDAVMSNPQEYGFCAVVAKPYRMAELEHALATVLPKDGGETAG